MKTIIKTKKIYKFLRKNYFFTFFIIFIVFVGAVVFVKITFSKSEYLYVKVKIGQGFWWVNGARPNIWYADAIKKGDISKDLFGKSQAEIISVKRYRWFDVDQLDVFITARLKVSLNKKTGEYTYNRSVLSVSAPVEIQFPKIDITGAITAISKTPFKDKYIEKTIYLNKRYAYPWEFDAIIIGDKYFDGENTIFEVLDKNSVDTINISSDPYGNSSPNTTESQKYITIKAKIKLKQGANAHQLIFGEDQLISPGKKMNLATTNFVFMDYMIGKIE